VMTTYASAEPSSTAGRSDAEMISNSNEPALGPAVAQLQRIDGP
jgi:hypothetical protein